MGSLSEKQQSIVEGCMLGDGYMRCKKNAHLQITHSIKQKVYVDWKYSRLRKYVLTPPKTYKGNEKRIGYRFFTRSLPQFTRFYHRFYINSKKIIPRDVKITPLALAVWFMDDGSTCRNSSYLNTQQFKYNDQSFLQRVLHDMFGLKSNLDRDKHYFRIRFTSESSQKLHKIVNSYVLSSMQYKFPI